MNSNLFKLFIYFLVMIQFETVISVGNNPPTPDPSDHVNGPKNISFLESLEIFHTALKSVLNQLNCTNVTLLDPENSKEMPEEFCHSVENISSWNSCSQPSVEHLVNNIFRKYELCIYVCTANLKGTLWPICNIIRNLTEVKQNQNVSQSTGSTPTNNSVKPTKKLEENQKVDSFPKANSEVIQNGDLSPAHERKAEPEEQPLSSPVDDNLKPVGSDNESDDSHYFIFFVVISVLCILFYIAVYNKKKICALLIEGPRRKDRRRHASAGYRKLNTNLEEVMPLGPSQPSSDSLIY